MLNFREISGSSAELQNIVQEWKQSAWKWQVILQRGLVVHIVRYPPERWEKYIIPSEVLLSSPSQTLSVITFSPQNSLVSLPVSPSHYKRNNIPSFNMFLFIIFLLVPLAFALPTQDQKRALQFQDMLISNIHTHASNGVSGQMNHGITCKSQLLHQ